MMCLHCILFVTHLVQSKLSIEARAEHIAPVLVELPDGLGVTNWPQGCHCYNVCEKPHGLLVTGLRGVVFTQIPNVFSQHRVLCCRQPSSELQQRGGKEEQLKGIVENPRALQQVYQGFCCSADSAGRSQK